MPIYHDLPKLTYDQIRSVFFDSDPNTANNYISHHLAIVLRSPQSIINAITKAPFRFDEMRLALLLEGSATSIINLHRYEIKAGDILFVSGGSIAEIRKTSPKIVAKLFSCTDELLAMAFKGDLPSMLRRRQNSFILHMKEENIRFFETTLQLLWDTIHQEGHSPQVVFHLMGTLLYYVNGLHEHQDAEEAVVRTREQHLFDQFITLVNRHATTEHTLDFYADKLCLSPRYLGSIIKAASGLTAKEWIDRQLLLTIQIELKHTDKPLKRIATEMNFPTMSFFGKYFKRLTGITPMQYRNQN